MSQFFRYVFKWFYRLFFASYLLAFIISGGVGALTAVVFLIQGNTAAALGIVGSIVPIAVILIFVAWVFSDVQRISTLIDKRRAALGLPPAKTDDDDDDDENDDSSIEEDEDFPAVKRPSEFDEAIKPAPER